MMREYHVRFCEGLGAATSPGYSTGRDPLGYVDGMSLCRGYFVPNATDPTGSRECNPIAETYSLCPCSWQCNAQKTSCDIWCLAQAINATYEQDDALGAGIICVAFCQKKHADCVAGRGCDAWDDPWIRSMFGCDVDEEWEFPDLFPDEDQDDLLPLDYYEALLEYRRHGRWPDAL